jgi:hypothetical protein
MADVTGATIVEAVLMVHSEALVWYETAKGNKVDSEE